MAIQRVIGSGGDGNAVEQRWRRQQRLQQRQTEALMAEATMQVNDHRGVDDNCIKGERRLNAVTTTSLEGTSSRL